MMEIGMSPAAAGLLRLLLARAGVERDRILLTEFRCSDWQSLTFCGERQRFSLRVPGPEAAEICGRIVQGLEDAELSVSGHLVADIVIVGEPRTAFDGSITLDIEALTVVDD